MATIEVLAFLVGLMVLIYAVVMGAWYFRRRDRGTRLTTTARRCESAGKVDSY